MGDAWPFSTGCPTPDGLVSEELPGAFLTPGRERRCGVDADTAVSMDGSEGRPFRAAL